MLVKYLEAFWDYLVLTAPYLLLGLIASGIIHEFINLKTIRKHLAGHGLLPVIKASLFGVPLPLCSCSVIPAAVTLKKQGASNGATSSFLISTPESGVDSMVMTYGVMDLPMTVIRPVAAFLTATIAGVLQNFFNTDVLFEDHEHDHKHEHLEKEESCHSHGEGDSCSLPNSKDNQVKRVLRYSFEDLSDDLAFWLLIGLLVGALMNLVLPVDLFAKLPDWGERLLVLGFGIPFYICASASTPIAASMMMKGMSPGVALIFLLVGPATNFTNLAVLQKYLGKKGTIINILSIALVSLLLSFVVDWAYDFFQWSKTFKIENLHDHQGAWWEQLMAIFLLVLILKGIYKEKVKPYLSKENSGGCCG